MINIKIRKLIQKTSKIILMLLPLFLVGWFILNFHKFAIEACLDDGKVWDYAENRCRNDCLKWGKEYGCIKLTPKQITLFENCRHNLPNCISVADYKEICLNNQKAWNIDEEDCYFEFSEKDCAELSGSWQYPDICSDKK